MPWRRTWWRRDLYVGSGFTCGVGQLRREGKNGRKRIPCASCVISRSGILGMEFPSGVGGKTTTSPLLFRSTEERRVHTLSAQIPIGGHEFSCTGRRCIRAYSVTPNPNTIRVSSWNHGSTLVLGSTCTLWGSFLSLYLYLWGNVYAVQLNLGFLFSFVHVVNKFIRKAF